MNFKDFDLNPEIIAGLDKLGYETPTKIQEEVILEYIKGKNIIGQSQTGTGKTAAFIISLLQSIDLKKPGVQALILAPTRELVMQIREEIVALSAFMYIRSLPVFGGSSIYKQMDMLRKDQTIVVGTPGRVIDLIERRALRLENVEYFVLDEVDRMLDMGFIDDIDFIWGSMKNIKQSLAFSATITDELKSMVEKYLGVNYTFIKATDSITVEKIDHSFMEVAHLDKYDALKKYIKKNNSKKTLVFVQTKRDTEIVAGDLKDDGFRSDFLNGDMRQRERFKALKDFQEGRSDIFVVTDVAARGLNIKNIDLVVNLDVPIDPESYIHRIGRTGRAGAEGKAIMFVSSQEKMSLKNIERRNKIKIKQVDEEGNEIERQVEQRRSFSGGGRNSGGYSRGGRSGGSSSYGRSSGARGSYGRSSGGGNFSSSNDSRPPRRDSEGFTKFENPEANTGPRRKEIASRWDNKDGQKSGYFAEKEKRIAREDSRGNDERRPRENSRGYEERKPRSDNRDSGRGFDSKRSSDSSVRRSSSSDSRRNSSTPRRNDNRRGDR
ncbi:MAG: DEAD/DEAH box helicase [Candidatus Gracilibacteria bacterium]|nr:DEAD/DEAH box helicase [Candidatus Gracilibacteria bacterium]